MTGESDSKRVLYTDDEDLIWAMKRVVLLNGINPPSDASDVQDRTLPIELQRVSDVARVTEETFWEHFELRRPEYLGAVFTALSGALRQRHTVELDEKPRLADWGMYAAALYESEGWGGAEQFTADWRVVKGLQHQGTLDGSIVAQAIIKFMEDKSYEEHPASDLHKKIEKEVGEDLNLSHDKNWPKTGRTLWNKIKEVIPLLESQGIWAWRSPNAKRGRPIVLSTKPGDGPDGSGGGFQVNDKVNDNGDLVNDNGLSVNDNGPSGTIPFTTSFTANPANHAEKGDLGPENASGERYFGVTLGSHTSSFSKEIEDTDTGHTQGESNPDLSFTTPGSLVAVDTETTGLNPMRDEVCILQYQVEGGEPQIIGRDEIPAFLEDLDKCEAIFHNGVFDLAMLKSNFGWTPKRRVWDTMILSQLAYAGDKNVRSHGLKAPPPLRLL